MVMAVVVNRWSNSLSYFEDILTNFPYFVVWSARIIATQFCQMSSSSSSSSHKKKKQRKELTKEGLPSGVSEKILQAAKQRREAAKQRLQHASDEFVKALRRENLQANLYYNEHVHVMLFSLLCPTLEIPVTRSGNWGSPPGLKIHEESLEVEIETDCVNLGWCRLESCISVKTWHMRDWEDTYIVYQFEWPKYSLAVAVKAAWEELFQVCGCPEHRSDAGYNDYINGLGRLVELVKVGFALEEEEEEEEEEE